MLKVAISFLSSFDFVHILIINEIKRHTKVGDLKNASNIGKIRKMMLSVSVDANRGRLGFYPHNSLKTSQITRAKEFPVLF